MELLKEISNDPNLSKLLLAFFGVLGLFFSLLIAITNKGLGWLNTLKESKKKTKAFFNTSRLKNDIKILMGELVDKNDDYDKAEIWSLNNGAKIFGDVHKWTSNFYVEYQADSLNKTERQVRTFQLSDWEMLVAGMNDKYTYYVIDDVDDLPNGSLRNYLKSYGVGSVLTKLLTDFNGEPIGLMILYNIMGDGFKTKDIDKKKLFDISTRISERFVGK